MTEHTQEDGQAEPEDISEANESTRKGAFLEVWKMLNKKEQNYFNAMKRYISSLFCVPVGIYPLDHKAFIPMGKDEEILGCCHKLNDDYGNLLGFVITIDEPYIKACYNGRQKPYSPFSDNQLIETICHEIAHLFIWEHNEEHKALTNELYDAVMFRLEHST